MIILCIDGIDPELVKEFGWNDVFTYNVSLSIPKECYVLAGDDEDPDRMQPHTTRVWATIFTGQIIDYGLIKRTGLRKKAHDFLVRHGITWRKAKNYKVAPVNEGLDNIFKHHKSFHWNIPTISPEWIATFPNYEAFEIYCKREYLMWRFMTFSAVFHFIPLQAFYTRWIDMIGHNRPDKLRQEYDDIFVTIQHLQEKTKDLIVISDHGCKDGWHTDHAYIGSDIPCHITGIEHVRSWLETIV